MRWYAILLVALTVLVPFLPVNGMVAQTELVGIVADTPNEVYRRYAAEESNAAPVFEGRAMSLYSYGYITLSENDAKEEFRSIVTSVPLITESMAEETSHETGVNIEITEHREVEFPSLGDESAAFVMPAKYGRIDVEFAVAAIRDANWLQLLSTVAFNVDGETVNLLADVASAAKKRWPNESEVKVRPDGIRYGGIWALALLPDDVPNHLVLDKSYDEGPGPGSLPPMVDPIPTPTMSAPTPTQIPEPVALPTRSSEPSSRLAKPFNVTIRIILANGTFSAGRQSECTGEGRYSYLHEEGLLALKSADGVESLVLVRGLQPGYLSYDLPLQTDVCVFEVGIRDVPPRAAYLLVAGNVPIASFAYEELNTGVVVEVVVGS